MRLLIYTFLLVLGGISIHAQNQDTQHVHPHRHIQFPDVPGYLTLICDFHQHSVFSDGNVWPTIRVEEAVKDGLDAMSLTEHLEYQPHLDDIPHPDRNRAYEIASQFAEALDVLIIPGVEVTRRMPPGHSNALFIQDANKMLVEDSLEVFREAQRQDAFVFWNHPDWMAQADDGIARLSDFHRFLIQEDLLHGIEVVNQYTYSDEALQIALENDLTIMGTSDVHGLIDWEYDVHEGDHRPVTLVFSEERSAAGIKAALQARRTAVWFNNTLIGKTEHLMPLLESSIQIGEAHYPRNKQVATVEIINQSDADFVLENLSPYTLHRNTRIFQVPAHTTTELRIKTLDVKTSFQLMFRVLNAVVAPNEHPILRLEVQPAQH